MDSKRNSHEQMTDINMNELLAVIWGKVWFIIITAVLCAGISYIGTEHFATPVYQSSALFYVNNTNVSVDGIAAVLTSDDIRVSKHMVDIYEVILNTRKTLDEVIQYAGVDAQRSDLSGRIEVPELLAVERVNDTEVFRVYVNWKNPEETERIANAIANVLPRRIDEIVEDTSARIVDYAVLPSEPIMPDPKNNLVLGGLMGIVLSAGLVALRYLFDTRIKSEMELYRYGDLPILAMIPTLDDGELGTKHKTQHIGKSQKPRLE